MTDTDTDTKGLELLPVGSYWKTRSGGAAVVLSHGCGVHGPYAIVEHSRRTHADDNTMLHLPCGQRSPRQFYTERQLVWPRVDFSQWDLVKRLW